MKTIDVDSMKIKEAGQDIINLSFELIVKTNNFYGRINDIPFKTREWIGETAERYVRSCVAEKEIYLKFYNSLSKLGEILVSYSDALEKKIRDEL